MPGYGGGLKMLEAAGEKRLGKYGRGEQIGDDAAKRRSVWLGNKKGGRSGRLATRAHLTTPLMNSQGHQLVSLKMCAQQKTPQRGVSLSVTDPSSGAGAGLWVWLRSRAACDRQS